MRYADSSNNSNKSALGSYDIDTILKNVWLKNRPASDNDMMSSYDSKSRCNSTKEKIDKYFDGKSS